ncbi:MAG: hypothetical protein RJA98_3814 [Pseudomonadota bacterium]|jgi:predicted aminopeptidase
MSAGRVVWRRGVAAVLAGVMLLAASGCSTVGYYGASVSGHLALLRAARPVPEVLADPASPEWLKARLALSQRIRDFAVSDISLPDNAGYRRYADLGRSAAVWNVVATPELSLTLQTWCFPIVGCVGYRGYFDQAEAEAFGQTLRAQGLEVSVYPVPAYSTLGRLPGDFFADPLLNTFIRYPEGELARLIIHELSHQVAYAAGDTLFNESFATAVERIGAERWLAQRATAEAREDYAKFDARRQDFRALTLAHREKLAALYASAAPDADKRRDKASLQASLQANYARLKAERWGGYAGFDGWFAQANNASFAVQAAYTAWAPAFEALYAAQGRDFPRFFAEVRRLAALPAEQRRAALGAP